MESKPVIFLAFANDKVDDALFLRNLSQEMHGIRRSLAEAESKGLCEIVERSSVTIGDILDVFQNPQYTSRIAIFHYGGHADGFSLLLEKEDGTNSKTHRDGFVPFMAKQTGLKLVFLNGCSSEDQANALREAGISCVIGTSASINDEVATKLALRFYSALGDGHGIEKSWADAVDEVKITNGTGNSRAMHWKGMKDIPDRFPWMISFKDGAENTKTWNLPDESGNPLFRLPEIPQTYDLPESPFLYLKRYERKHAEVFFGRSNLIRSVYTYVTDRNAPGIILFYGQSGVGKSSFLDAGLQPRLEKEYDILYLRRDGDLGLSETVYRSLLNKAGVILNASENEQLHEVVENRKIVENLKFISDAVNPDIKIEIDQIISKLKVTDFEPERSELPDKNQLPTIQAAWKYIENKSGRPLLIILDQVEEAYTRPNQKLGNEVNHFFNDIKECFMSPSMNPSGKIILSYRKEYHPEIEEYCINYQLPRSKVYIEHISKKDVFDVFNGFEKSRRLKARYNLNVEEGLPSVIASDLEQEKDSPIAPMLQILLTKMWIKAQVTSSDTPVFTHNMYREQKEEGLAMDEFLQTQLGEFKNKLPLEFQNGFAIDVLEYYCTPNGTAAARTLEQVKQRYPNAKELDSVLKHFKELYLITDLDTESESAMLAHDTLAKSVVKLYQKSAYPVQQARRVIFSRMEAKRSGSDNASLDMWDLALYDKVKDFIPALSADEQSLIALSREENRKIQRDKNKLVFTRRAFVAISVLGAILVSGLYVRSRSNELKSFINSKAAESSVYMYKDPTFSLQLAAEGFDVEMEESTPEVKRALAHTFYNSENSNQPLYKIFYDSKLNFIDLISNKSNTLFIPFAEADELPVINGEGQTIGLLKCTQNGTNRNYFRKILISSDSRQIYSLDAEGRIQTWALNGALQKSTNDGIEYIDVDISPFNNEILALNFDENGAYVDRMDKAYNVIGTFFSDSIILSINSVMQGEGVMLATDTNLEIRDNNWELLYNLDPKDGSVYECFSSPSGSLFLAATENYITVWDNCGKVVKKIEVPDPEGQFIKVSFAPSDSMLVITQFDTVAHLFHLYPKPTPKLSSKLKGSKSALKNKNEIHLKHGEKITFAQFSEDGSKIITGSAENNCKIWNLRGELLYQLLGHKQEVNAARIISKDNHVYRVSSDGTFIQWILIAYKDENRVINVNEYPISYLDLSPTVVSEGKNTTKKNGDFILTSSKDNVLRIWETKGFRMVDSINFGKAGLGYAEFISPNEIIGSNHYGQGFYYELFGRKPILLKGHTQAVKWLATLNDTIITAALDSTIRLWNKEGKQLLKIKPGAKIISLAASKIGGKIAAGSTKGEIYIYNSKGKEITVLNEHKSPVRYLDMTYDGGKLVSISTEKAIIWDLVTMKNVVLERISCSPYYQCQYNTVMFSFNQKYVIASSSDKVARIWNVDGTLISRLVGHTDEVNGAFFGPDDKVIYTFSKDGTARIWDISGREIAVLKGHKASVESAYMDHDLTRMFSASADGSFRIWKTPLGVFNWLQKKQYIQMKK